MGGVQLCKLCTCAYTHIHTHAQREREREGEREGERERERERESTAADRNIITISHKHYYNNVLLLIHTAEYALKSWSKGKMKSLPFAVPLVWREGTNHVTDCYFCMTNLQGKLILGSNNDN